MYCSDLNMATLKTGSAGGTQSTKLMLPHEMLASATSVPGHSATLLLNPSVPSYFASHSHHSHMHHSNIHNSSHHTNSFQSSFSSFAANNGTATTTTTAATTTSSTDFRTSTTTTATMHNASTTTTSSHHQSEVPVAEVKTEIDESKCESENNTTATSTDGGHNGEVKGEQEQDEPEIDIVISNVVCSFSVRCHLNLRMIALNGCNVEFRRENGMVTMKLRRPYTTASIWSSGRITCTGATSEDQVSPSYAR